MPKNSTRSKWKYAQTLCALIAVLLGAGTSRAFDPLNGDYSRDEPRDVRVMSYNHARNFISDSSVDTEFHRIFSAIDPDLICMQEFPDSVSANDIANRLNSIIPIGGQGWQVHLGLYGGIRTVIASRYPLLQTRIDTVPASSTRGVTIALADLPDDDYAVDVYLMGVHLKCCGDSGGSEDASRQDSADAMANWLGDARGVSRPFGDHVELPSNTPMLLLGDFNLVGGPQPENTIVTGDIQDTGSYGGDVKGDWDNTNLTNLMPADPFTGNTFTWQGNGTYPPSALDRIFFTDSAVTIANSFVLNTDTMPWPALLNAGLLDTDTLPSVTSDHLPIVADLRLPPPPECTLDTECDDTLFCNGIESCTGAQECAAGIAPCASGEWCDEQAETCHTLGNGDFEPDGRVDLRDFAAFERCFGQLGFGVCAPANITGDSALIDHADLAAFTTLLVGP